jgi:hypothetical protein
VVERIEDSFSHHRFEEQRLRGVIHKRLKEIAPCDDALIEFTSRKSGDRRGKVKLHMDVSGRG